MRCWGGAPSAAAVCPELQQREDGRVLPWIGCCQLAIYWPWGNRKSCKGRACCKKAHHLGWTKHCERSMAASPGDASAFQAGYLWGRPFFFEKLVAAVAAGEVKQLVPIGPRWGQLHGGFQAAFPWLCLTWGGSQGKGTMILSIWILVDWTRNPEIAWIV